jgi:nitrite reductase (NADH) small subunit
MTLWNLGLVDRIPTGEGKTFQVGAVAVAVFRTRSGQLYATQASCPHRGGPLSDGLIGGRTVACPLHGLTFDLASGQPLTQRCQALKTFPIEVSPTGELMLTVEHAEVPERKVA